MNKRLRFQRVAGTLVFTALLVATLVFALQIGVATNERIADTFNHQARIQTAQLDLEEMLRAQSQEENLVRGYVQTQDPSYSAQYEDTKATLDDKQNAVRKVLQDEGLTSVLGELDDYNNLQHAWRNQIASPQIESPLAGTTLDKRSKLFSDYESRDAALIRSDLKNANDILGKGTEEQLNGMLYARAFWLLLFGLLAILFNAYRSRLNRELEQERTTTDTLQRAFRSEFVPLPNSEIGGSYGSASSHLAVGGDVFDVYRLSESRALLLIADVSGKGVDAAVLTAFIKFTIRSIALRHGDPGAILAEFNTAFAKTVDNPYLFVSMFVGILDTRKFLLQYASAGHDSAYLRRANDGVHALQVTGPVLGVMRARFATKVVRLRRGDTILLATDGLTEVRNRRGEQLGEAGALKLIESGAANPQELADELIAHVREIGGSDIHDDVAILAVRIVPSRNGKRG